MPADAPALDSGIVFEPIRPADAGTAALRQDLLETWVAVINAGGAVGFVAPADVTKVANALDAALEPVAAGRDALGILRRGDTAVAMGFLIDHGHALRSHWRTVVRLMVHPELQGIGAGGLLLQGLHQLASSMELEQLQLTVRGGMGLEGFYEHFGYVVVGRHPGAIRVAPGEDRDEVMLIAQLGRSPQATLGAGAGRPPLK